MILNRYEIVFGPNIQNLVILLPEGHQSFFQLANFDLSLPSNLISDLLRILKCLLIPLFDLHNVLLMLLGTDVFLLFTGPKLVCQPFHFFLKVLHSPFENHFVNLVFF